jgi:hypothetical protein
MAKKTKLESPTTQAQFLTNALDRIDVLERLVEALILQAGAHPPYVDKWRQNLIHWPDVEHSVNQDARYLVEWAQSLRRSD